MLHQADAFTWPHCWHKAGGRRHELWIRLLWRARLLLSGCMAHWSGRHLHQAPDVLQCIRRRGVLRCLLAHALCPEHRLGFLAAWAWQPWDCQGAHEDRLR